MLSLARPTLKKYLEEGKVQVFVTPLVNSPLPVSVQQSLIGVLSRVVVVVEIPSAGVAAGPGPGICGKTPLVQFCSFAQRTHL